MPAEAPEPHVQSAATSGDPRNGGGSMWVCLLLTLALAAGGVAACGSDEAPSPTSPTESTSGGVDVTAPGDGEADAGNSTEDEDSSGNQSDAGDSGSRSPRSGG
jgi:hypothetical protein